MKTLLYNRYSLPTKHEKQMCHRAEYIKAYWLRKQHIYSYLLRAILEHDFESPPVQKMVLTLCQPTPHINPKIKRGHLRDTGKKSVLSNRNKIPTPIKKAPEYWPHALHPHITQPFYQIPTWLLQTQKKRSPSFSMECSSAQREQYLFNFKQNIVCILVVAFIYMMPVHRFMLPLYLIQKVLMRKPFLNGIYIQTLI